ncbi:ATP-binding cassette domain-containing protein [Clostridium sp. 001]|nr:ATP-binding cassette domain-containing protein [Clostridium sp. 001]
MPQCESRTDTFDKKDCIILKHANIHCLKDLTVAFPLHVMVGIAGLSGSGKSSLIEDTLLKRITSARKYGHASGITGVERISSFAKISQEPIGKSAISTPASYIGIWDKIRELFAKQPEAKIRNMNAGYFSFHSKGACPDCGGSGYERIFLTSNFSVDKLCPTCHGKRFQEESLLVKYKEKTITDVLEMSIIEAVFFFADQSNIAKPLHILDHMGMGYLTLGQPTSSLSGGEAQRVKLAKELGKQRGGNMLYVLDEPTTGLSMYDTALLLKLLDHLVTNGNSVIIIEHNIDVLKNCDYIIELGPEGGDMGGEIIAKGTPEQLTANPNSKTGRYLICS